MSQWAREVLCPLLSQLHLTSLAGRLLFPVVGGATEVAGSVVVITSVVILLESGTGLAVLDNVPLGILLVDSPNKALVFQLVALITTDTGLWVRFLLGMLDSKGKWIDGLLVASTAMIAGRTVLPLPAGLLPAAHHSNDQ